MSSGSDSADPPARDATVADAMRLAYFDVGPADVAALRALAPLAERTVDGIVSEFYAYLLRVPELRRLLDGRLDLLPKLQRAHFLSLTDAQFGDADFERRRRVGRAHQAIGLDPTWYIGAYALYLRLALRRLVDGTPGAAELLPAVEALVKTIFLDMSLAIDTYIEDGFVTRGVAAKLERSVEVAEEALRARQETERLKDELASMVVHDLKNPVNGIAMLVDLALRKREDLAEHHARYFSHIGVTCREMMRLIENLLEIAKIEEGKMPVVAELVQLGELVDEVMHEYEPLAAQSARALRAAVPAGVPPVRADRSLLRRVLVNLVVNALRHSGSPDVVVDAAVDAGANEVIVAVHDHGRGIPPELQPRVFERFAAFRRSPADEPLTDSGLGLPFCKLAIEAMGGRIVLTSRVGAGTTFAVTLPVYA